MQQVPLNSSLLVSATYHLEAHLLDVEFRSGERYRYLQVPPACFHELLSAESKGRYFNYHIRNCFSCQHLSDNSTPIVLATAKTK
jgi:KTSC domain